MWTWVQRASQISNIGRFVWLLIGGSAAGGSGIAFAIVSQWNFLLSAPFIFQLLIALCLFIILLALVVGVAIYAYLPVGPGIFSPRHLRRYRIPIGKLSWDFDNCIAGRSGDGRPVEATGFQAQFKINRGRGISPKRAFIKCDVTGRSVDVLIECGNPYLRAEEIDFIPRRKWYRCHAAFVSEKTKEQGVLKEEFLKNWDGFKFVFEYDDTTFVRFFPRREIENFFDGFWRFCNPPPELQPTSKS